jgi:hypothetical protein
MKVALAATYHDPKGRLCKQIQRVLPALGEIFSGLAIRASRLASESALSLFADAGALVKRVSTAQLREELKLGAARREAISLALRLDTPFVLSCDGDRVLHWAANYPAELAQVVERLSANDFTVLGRTERAFNSHPRVQRNTEAIVNYIFQVVSGYHWDVMVGARGLSRRTVETILQTCFDEEISTDVSWPLFIQSIGEFSLGYIETEGLEFETPARYSEEITAVGGYSEWLRQRDADLNRWIHRLDLARKHVEAMIPFSPENTG